MLALRWGESDVRWPLAERSARAALRLLLAPDDAESRSELGAALAVDAPLAGWMLVQARRHGAPPPATIAALTDWVPKAGAIAWRGVEARGLPPELARAWRELSASALRDAREIDPQADTPRYLAALVRRLPPPGVALQAARAAGSARDGEPTQCAAEPPEPAERPLLACLPALVERLARLADLEAQFDETLEAEKLASMAELAAGAGHEINNPLAVIAGRAELLLRGEPHPERRRDLAVIHTQALRVRTLISDLMLFARPPRLRLAPADLSALTARVVAELVPLAESRGIVLACEVPPPSTTIEIDAVQIEVALRAVLDNALEAAPDGGRVQVVARADAERARITVADSGPGIAPDVRRHLFDPFYSGRQAGRGLGFGLAKCWRIVTLHGGRLDVAGEAGSGARITIELPCSRGTC